MKRQHFASCTVLLLALAATATAQDKKPAKVTYEDDVQPILRAKCFSCHNPDKKEGDLDLTNYGNLMTGGGSGAVVEGGDSAASYLYMLMTHESEPYMPPEQPKIDDASIETVRKWIDGGVLETKASKIKIKKKKSFNFALQDAPLDRPAVPPMPPRLSLEPVNTTGSTTAISALATSPWSPLAAVAGQKQVLLYNTKTLQLIGTLPFPEGIPQVLKFSRNGSLLLAGGGRGGASGKAIVWNIQTGERIFEAGTELDAVLAADISSDQTLIALGGPQKIVRIYSTETGLLLHELRKHTDWIYQLEFSPDSVLLASGDRNGGLMVWEGWTGREYLTLKGHTKSITGISWRSDSNLVATGSEDTTIKLWEMENGGQVKSWGAHGGGVASLEFARDGRILSCGRDRVTKLWDQAGKQLVAFEAFSDLALRATFCDETNRAIAGDWNGVIRVWNAADGKRVGELSPNPPALATRLAAATTNLTGKQAAHKPLAAAYAASKAAADKINADLAAAKTKDAAAKKLFDAAAAKLTAAKNTTAAATKAYEAATQAVAAIASGVPKLTEASAMAETAANMLKDDAELAKMAASLKVIAAKKAELLAAKKKAQAVAAAALAAAKKNLATAGKSAKDTDVAFKASQKVVAGLVPKVKPAVDAAAKAKQAVDAAASLVSAAQAEVSRWNGEIVFAKQLAQLGEQLVQANGVLEQRQITEAELTEVAQAAVAASGKAKAELASASGVLTTATQQAVAAKTQLGKSKAAVTAAEAASAQATKTVASYQTLLAPLNEAVVKAKDAAAKSGNEKPLVDAANTLAAIAVTKQANLVAAQKDAEVKAKAIGPAKQAVAVSEKKMIAATAAVTAAQKVVVAKTTAAKPLADKAAAANATVAAATKTSAAAQAAVDQVNAKIATAKGIGTV